MDRLAQLGERLGVFARHRYHSKRLIEHAADTTFPCLGRVRASLGAVRVQKEDHPLRVLVGGRAGGPFTKHGAHEAPGPR